jgi:ribosomal protein L22
MSETPRENDVDETTEAAEAAATEQAPATEAAAAEEAPAADAAPAEEAPAADAAPAEEEAPATEAAETEAAEEPAGEEPAAEEAPAAEAAAPAQPARRPAPTPAPRRADGRVVVRAQAKYVRTSARKARLVADHVRGKSVQEARAILAHTPRAAARDWAKLLESAVANAENNHELIGDDLRIYAIAADEGPTLKRFRPRAMGRATRIRKRTSHLTIQLTPKETR